MVRSCKGDIAMLKRKIERELARFKATNPESAILLTGARQDGKTFIVRKFAQCTAEALPKCAFALFSALWLAIALVAPVQCSAQGAAGAYVQRGLVAQYDGIDNAGTGSHDSSATTWKNLTGDDSLDGTCADELSWSANGWSVSGACKPVTLGTGIAQVISRTNCTIEVACKPAFVNKRFVYFSQYNGGSSYRSMSIENTIAGKYRLFRTRTASGGSDYNWTDLTPAGAADTFVSFAFALANKYPKFYKDGELKASATAAWGDASASTESVIGGELWASSNRTGTNFDSTYKVAFNGTYHAFRVYNVTLTAAEIAWNAGLDAVRFNGADAETALGPGCSYDAATDTLTITTSYAPAPGTDAADGLKFDISFTGDETADGLTFSSSNAADKQGYVTDDVALPVLPAVTNANTICLYFPTPSDTSALTTYRQDARKNDAAVTGKVATVFLRFRWDGAVQPSAVNYPSLIMNGYTSWSNYPTEGFLLRLRSDANSSQGNFSLVVPGLAVDYNNSYIVKTGTQYVNAGRWVDVFASVYPSPTHPTLSNADIWFCEVPSWNSGGYFTKSEIGHYHFADGCKIPRMDTTTQKTVIFGSEPNAIATPLTWTSNNDNAVKCFRGAIACAKGWNRILSTNEMWTVMADLGGVQSFTDLTTSAGRTYTTDYLDTDYFREGRNGTQTSFLGGDDPAAHRWRALSTTYKSNTLLWDAPKDAAPMSVIYSTKIANVSTGKTQPIHLEVNGMKVWPADIASKEVAKGEEIKVAIGAEYTYPGLNELKWVYDTAETSNWLIFDHHKIKLVTPANPFVITIQ